ncbi:conserved hypothetical protein [Leishmania major strain Friedlin]|uniref:Uncharacterized protein n=1 Tax=Leishmania major TaxID=5664 RepID=Q4Q7X9_LEIMA|nr:conserved hypothetical protein [Leishmania major strain Friedlin]CAG9577406.1 hypothetical_protein_-_conserved [Leishmania major strain Friedlin]CAJ05741.1 conserved hypothetical protein [Leishmania major strain Friedlin]|eukprot:XP_001684569.1 conserved hypothetical protein [Leishmania major strain Friedlin]
MCIPTAPSAHTPGKAVPASTQRFGGSNTAAVFQAKLQRALWLDQLTTIAHNEARARAKTRCNEAEERDALWWQHQRERQRQQHIEDKVFRLEALHEAQAAPVWDVLSHRWADLVMREEASDRRAVEAVAQDGLRMLYAAPHTWQLQEAVRELEWQQRDAEAVQHAAKHVRTLELKLAARSYRAVPAFEPAVDDLFNLAEGIHMPASAPPAPKVVPPSPSLPVNHEPPCEAKIREIYDRRALVYDEAKERLLLDWWQGAAQLRYVEALSAWQSFALWSYYVRSPVCMRALVTVQQWWRMQRVAPWSRHRRAALKTSLGKLRGHYYAERCRQHLRSLQRTLSREKDGDTSAADDISAALVALAAAATSSRRYRTQMDLYTYTVVQKARAALASRPIQDAAVAAMMQVSLRPMYTCDRYPLPYDSWRHCRWALYSEAHRLAAAAVERAETSHRQCVEAEEAKYRHHAAVFRAILHRGPLAVLDLRAGQVALAQEERRSQLRIAHQETYEYNVLRATVAAELPSLSQADPPLHRCKAVNREVKREAQTTAAAMSIYVAAHSLGGHGTTESSDTAAASSSTEQGAWAQVLRCAQLAHEVLASTQEQSAQAHPERSGASTDTETAAALSEDAVSLYCAAFDEAATAVYHDQYTSVRERYVARNAEALEQMRESFKAGLRERAIIIAEEAQELEHICHCDTSARHINCFRLERSESDRRAALERAQGRVAAGLYEALSDSLHVSRWAAGARERDEEAHLAAARVRLHLSLPLPSLSPAERLLSREAVCRTRLMCDCAAALADVLVQSSRSYHERSYQDWTALCGRDGAALDSAASSHLPLGQMCILKANEWDGRRCIWREAQAGARTLLVDGHALYGANTAWSDYLFGHLKLTSEASYMDAQLREYLLMRVANVKLKVGELIQMETMARGRVEYAEAITRDLRFHLQRLRVE